jgi:DNA-binding SARP family transcriptional activator/TolB-like protein
MITLRLLGGAQLDGPDGPVAGRAGLRQRIALLAVLAVEHPRPASRDRLVAYLWPERDTDDARHLLRESLYILRSALGDDSVLSTGDDLRLNPDRLTCDLWEFDAALARDDFEAAVNACHGPFLNGFHLSDAEEFDRWADGERSRLARRYAQALEQLAERQIRGGDPRHAVESWSRLAREDPYNSRIALRYMQALEAAGDRAGALRHAGAHSELLRADLDAAPEAEVVALAERLRRESRAAAAEVPAPTGVASATPVSPGGERQERLLAPAAADSKPAPRRQWSYPAALALAGVIGLGVVGGGLSRTRAPELAPRRIAVAVFDNHTGRPDLDDLGSMTADWIIRGLMETPLIDVTDLEAIHAGRPEDAGRADPRALARRDGAGLVISGNYYRSGDSVLFQASIADVATGRILRSFIPVGAPIEHAADALEGLREGVASGLGALVNPANPVFPVDPDLIPPPSFAAYREFVAGLKQIDLGDWEAESRHYRRSAELDSTFMAPAIQLAFRGSMWDECRLTDSIRTTLERRRVHLTSWDRYTIDVGLARCRGEMETAVQLLGARLQAYPRSRTAQRHYAWSLVNANRPRAALEVLGRLDLRDPSWRHARLPPGYWCSMATSHHMLGHHREELAVTDRWRESSTGQWRLIRSRAMGALGGEREVLELLQHLIASPMDEVADPLLAMATELALHGHHQIGMVVAETVLARLETGPSADWDREGRIAWAERLLGRANDERTALERMVTGDADTVAKLDGLGRIAVLQGDVAAATRIDSILAEGSREPLRGPEIRGSRLLARAHIAAGLGRREEAVARLREAGSQGQFYDGAPYTFHQDPLLAPLRGYPPFEALLHSDN